MLLGTLFIISAPSGGGKTSLVSELIKKVPNLNLSISHTTRAPRSGEQDGLNYFFIDTTTFHQYEQQGLFLESAQVFHHWYGTSKKWVFEQLQLGGDVILEIDWQGAQRIKEQMECVGIFILPPSKEVLLERLKKRQQDSLEVIEARMAQANNEIKHYDEYDYVVINDHFDSALNDLKSIIQASRLRLKPQQLRHSELIDSLNA